MSLISIEEIEITSDNKINPNGIIVKEALKLMHNREQFTVEGYDEVIEMPEFLLTCYEIATILNQKRNNNSTEKRD